MSILEINDLHVTVEADGATKEILRGVDLTVRSWPGTRSTRCPGDR